MVYQSRFVGIDNQRASSESAWATPCLIRPRGVKLVSIRSCARMLANRHTNGASTTRPGRPRRFHHVKQQGARAGFLFVEKSAFECGGPHTSNSSFVLSDSEKRRQDLAKVAAIAHDRGLEDLRYPQLSTVHSLLLVDYAQRSRSLQKR